jgi:pilus assembly protein CpaC
MSEFPDASLRVRPLASSVVISGYVPRAEMVRRIVQMAEDYYPSVINNMTVGGVQQVLLHVRLMEVSRTKLRRMGFDWANFNNNDSIIQNVAGLIAEASVVPGMQQVVSSGGENLAFGIVNDNNSFFGFLEALRRYNLVKVLAEPTLVTVSGRPASFNVGGEFPIIVPQSLGTVSIEYRQFGTRVDFVPIVLGNGRVRLEVRPQVSEVDPSRSVVISNTTVPGLRTRWVDTAVEMNAGQTLALAGLIQNQVEAENRGLPWVSDLPWVGAAFRRVEEQNNEVELLVMVTPEFVDALDPHEVPPCGPGQLTTTPCDVDFFWRGYLEVPRCCPDGSCGDCHTGFSGQGGIPVQTVPYETELVPSESDIRGASATLRDVQPQLPTRSSAPPQPGLIGPLGYDDLE